MTGMENIVINNEELTIVKVELECGRHAKSGYDDDCETNTNNQTKSTCC